MTNAIHEIQDADCILITGSNTGESHPVLSYEVIRAVKKGASLIVIDPRKISMTEHATLHLQPKPGQDIYLFMAMAHVIIREGWADMAFIEERTEEFETFQQSVLEITPEVAALATGIPVEQIEKAARLYALGERQNGVSIYANGDGQPRGHSSILYAMGITQRSNGTELVHMLANLAMLGGQIGKPSTGVNPLRGQSNVQGACDLGGLPDVLPGYQKVFDEPKRKAVAQKWGVDDLPAEVGLTVVEMSKAMSAGRIRAMYVMGENPLMSDPDSTHVEKAFRSLDFMVAQDIFLNETGLLAHVILPAASSLEKDGTFTNTERRVQLLNPIVAPPGDAKPDWEIISALAEKFEEKMARQRNVKWTYTTTAEIMDEVATIAPIYGGISHQRLQGDGLQWPCPTPNHPGTPYLHGEKFSRGLGKFFPIEVNLPYEQPDEEYPLILTTGRVLYHYHSGTMTRRSEGLDWRVPRGYVEVNPADAEAIGLLDGGQVKIISRRGEVRTQARIGDRVPPGVVFLSFHWKEAPANVLTHDIKLDPIAKIPEYKATTVRLENPKLKRAKKAKAR